MPLGLLYDPRRMTIVTRMPLVESARVAGWLFEVRGLQMQKKHNQPEVFVQHLETALALVRNLEHASPVTTAMVGRAIESGQLMTLDHWLTQLGHRPGRASGGDANRVPPVPSRTD